jgi:hypothetical protein
MYSVYFIILCYNQQTHNSYHNSTYHNRLSVQSTLLHFSTFPCHHQTVYNQCLAISHTFFKLQMLKIQFITLRCFTSNLYNLLDCSCWNYNFYNVIKMLQYFHLYNKIEYNYFYVTICRAVSVCLWLYVQPFC